MNRALAETRIDTMLNGFQKGLKPSQAIAYLAYFAVLLLEAEDFEENGRLIARLGLPTLVTQQGGYRTAGIGGYALRFFTELNQWAV